jgi:hypothetical protein
MVRRVLIAALALALVVPAARAQDEKPWKAGAARVVITPDEFLWMSGYASRTRPADSKVHDLWAKALALEDPAGNRVLLLTMDLVGIDRDLAGAVCRNLMKKHGLGREAIRLAVSHTHSGPVVGTNLATMYQLDEKQTKLVADYAVALEEKLCGVASEALAKLEPARLQWAIGHCSVAVNRRNNQEKDVPALRETGKLAGPVDHDVPTLAVYDKKYRLIAITFGYACHATVLDGYAWCGDYPGFAQLALEKRHPDAIALFWAGCGGDQNPLPRRKIALADQYGTELADSVDAVLRGAMKPIRGKLAATFNEIDLPFAALPDREKLVLDSKSTNKTEASRAKLLLAELDRKGSLRSKYPYPVQAWRLGDELLWIALGGEAVVDYSLRLKKELGPGTTWVAAYSNDVMAYIPSARVLKEGRYEGLTSMAPYGLPAAWGPQVEELIVDEVHARVKELRK